MSQIGLVLLNYVLKKIPESNCEHYYNKSNYFSVKTVLERNFENYEANDNR